MGVVVRKPLPELEHIREEYPLSAEESSSITKHREEIQAILKGADPRALLIVGPCSAWPQNAVLTYTEKLVPVAEQMRDHVKIVMRVYTQKPRTTKGWAGVVVQPDPFAAPDIKAGAQYARSMMLEVTRLGLPIADELLFTHKTEWLGDLLSWTAIGARSAEDQEHRVFASGLQVPVGMKNPTSGEAAIGVNSVVSAQSAHTYYSNGEQVETNGNPYAHLVLRGGSTGPNHHVDTLAQVATQFEKDAVQNSSILIDASHDNSKYNGSKDHMRQRVVVEDTLTARKEKVPGSEFIRGFLVESFLQEGAQALSACDADTVNRSGLSITDPCVDWGTTVALIDQIAARWE